MKISYTNHGEMTLQEMGLYMALEAEFYITFREIENNVIEIMTDSLMAYASKKTARQIIFQTRSVGWKLERYESIVGLDIVRVYHPDNESPQA